MNKIAVVVLNWNGAELLRSFLPSVIKKSPQADIYVADNASTDNSIEIIQIEFPSVAIIRNKENYGFAKGYNEALANLDYEFFALINSDVEATENWLTPILEMFQTEPQTAIIQPKILDYKRKEYYEYAGAAGGYIDKYGFPYCRGRVFDKIEADSNKYDDFAEIFWASGACFFIRSSVFRELNGFDEDFFAHQEEIDLCWRAFNKNYSTKYNFKSVIYHVGGATLKYNTPQKTFLNFRNSLLMLTKNLPQKGIFCVLLTRLCLDGVAGIMFTTQGSFRHTLAIIKAHFSFYSLFSKNYKKRVVHHQTKRYYQVKSIVFSHYTKNIF